MGSCKKDVTPLNKSLVRISSRVGGENAQIPVLFWN